MSKKLFEEIERMLELINHRSENKIIGENIFIKNKEALKEEVDKNNDESEEGFEELGDLINKTEEKSLETESTTDLTLPLKVAFLAYNISEYWRDLFGIAENSDIWIPPIKAGDIGLLKKLEREKKETDEEYEKREKEYIENSKALFNRIVEKKLFTKNIRDEFFEWVSRDRIIPIFEERVETSAKKDGMDIKKWFATKNFNIIGYKNGTINDLGKKTINFLARALSDQPLNEAEAFLFHGIYKDSFRQTARRILESFYLFAFINTARQVLHKTKLSPENTFFVEESVSHALDQMAKPGNYTISKTEENAGAWILEVAKNKLKDFIKKVAGYVPNFENIAHYLEGRETAHPKGFVIIKSRFNPKGLKKIDIEASNIIDIQQIDKNLWGYIYPDTESALADFNITTKGGKRGITMPHLAHYNLPKEEREKFYTSVRETETAGLEGVLKTAGFVPNFDEIVDGLNAKLEAEPIEFPEKIETQIKSTIKQLIEPEIVAITGGRGMTKVESGILTDLIYALLQFTKPEERKGMALRNFINDFNEVTMNIYRNLPSGENKEKSEKQLKKELIDTHMWIRFDKKGQVEKIVNRVNEALRKFFTSDPASLAKLKKTNYTLYKNLARAFNFAAIPTVSTRRIAWEPLPGEEEQKAMARQMMYEIRKMIRKALNEILN